MPARQGVKAELLNVIKEEQMRAVTKKVRGLMAAVAVVVVVVGNRRATASSQPPVPTSEPAHLAVCWVPVCLLPSTLGPALAACTGVRLRERAGGGNHRGPGLARAAALHEPMRCLGCGAGGQAGGLLAGGPSRCPSAAL